MFLDICKSVVVVAVIMLATLLILTIAGFIFSLALKIFGVVAAICLICLLAYGGYTLIKRIIKK